MNEWKLASELYSIGTRGRDAIALRDCFEVLRSIDAKLKLEVVGTNGNLLRVEDSPEIRRVHEMSERLRETVRKILSESMGDTAKLLELDKNSMLFDGPHNFDAFCQYIECEKEDARQFYQPRRPQLLTVARDLQRLEYGELNILGISLPPGVGKSTTELFYLSWISGRNPDLANLLVSHSGDIIDQMFSELKRLVQPGGEYLWQDVFPRVKIAGVNSALHTLDLENRKRFPTVQMTTLGSSNAGKVRATHLLACDDLVSKSEQAMNPDQMDKLWRAYTVDCKQRKLGDMDAVGELHISTRWSQQDVLGRLEDLNRNNPKAKFINFPVCDSEGHSYFNYPRGLGYDDEAVKDLRKSMEDVYFQSLYMGRPYEKDGQLYPREELRRYLTLPDREPDAVIAVCDTKTTGPDYCVMPIVYQYGADYYIDDVVCENYNPDVVETNLVMKLLQHKVQQCQIESNVAGGKMASVIQDRVNEAGGITNITTKWTQANKETKILVNSTWVKTHCLFRDDTTITGKAWGEYRTFMTFLMQYSVRGRNRHDDVPDAMAQLALYCTKAKALQKVHLVKRWF